MFWGTFSLLHWIQGLVVLVQYVHAAQQQQNLWCSVNMSETKHSCLKASLASAVVSLNAQHEGFVPQLSCFPLSCFYFCYRNVALFIATEFCSKVQLQAKTKMPSWGTIQKPYLRGAEIEIVFPEKNTLSRWGCLSPSEYNPRCLGENNIWIFILITLMPDSLVSWKFHFMGYFF